MREASIPRRSPACPGLPMSADPIRPEPAESPVPQLSWRSFGLALAITLAIFFLLHPLWRPLDMEQMDRNIAWSYVPIPLLVLALLALEHKLRWSSWMLETLRLTLVKFAVTFLFANVLWAFIGPPGRAEPAAQGRPTGAPPAPAESRAPLEPTRIDPARTGRIDGLVVDDQGAPRAGVLVAVTGGLEGFVFAPDREGVVLDHDGDRLRPATAVVLVGATLTLRGESDQLHTAAATDEQGREVFNLPLVPGAERTTSFDKALGPITLKCTVDGRREHTTALAIVDNPFAAWTGQDGRFRLEGIPAGDLELTAWAPSRSKLQVHVRLLPGAVETPKLTVP